MSQNCGRPFAEPLITGYLDGVLSHGNCRRVRLHLRRCAACRRLLEDLRELRIIMMTTRWHPQHPDLGTF